MDPRTLEWGSEASQIRRFEVLNEVAELGRRTVLDVGCGLGQFAEFMIDRGIVFDDYVGVDATPELIARASGRYGGSPFASRMRWHVGDARKLDDVVGPETFDVVVASGLLYLHEYDDMLTIVRALYDRARVAVALNSLQPPFAPQGQFAYGPGILGAVAEMLDAPYVVRSDYARHDVTMYMYRRSPDPWPRPAWTVAHVG